MPSEGGQFDALREQLLKGGIAPRRVRRYLGELEGHLAALTETERAAGYPPAEATARARARLGSDTELTAAWLAHPRFKSLTARAPWLVFGLLPPFGMLLAFLVPVLTLVIIGKTNGFIGPHPIAASYGFQEAAMMLTWAGNLLTPALFAALLAVIATRQRLSATWPLIGMAVIALLGMQMHVSFPVSGHGHGSVILGMLPFAGRAPAIYWQTLPAQWLCMLVPALWIVISRRHAVRSSRI